MAPSKKRKMRREERKADPVMLPPQPKQDEEDEEQVDYEAAEEIHHQQQQQQQQIHQQLQQQEHPGADEYEDPEEDPADDGGGEGSSDDEEEEVRNGGGEDEDDEGEEEEDGEDADIDKLLEPLSREQLISLLRAAAASDPRTLAEIRGAADRDPSLRRIFVHGISYSTNAETLRSFFAQYGDVDECRIITDRVTGKSKGYGFIVFSHGRSARRALKEPQKFIDGRMTACQMATVGPAATVPVAPQPPPPPVAAASHPPTAPYHTPQDVLPRKIFVGNVNPDVNKDRLVQFFSQFGEIEEGPLGFDRQTGKAKGYALFIFKTVEGARKALQEPNKNFDGRLLYCQKATDSQRVKAAAAAAAAASGPTATPGPVTPDVQGNMGYNVAPAGAMAFPGAMDMGLAQGFFGAALPFAQGMQANPAALAMLAAAGQNPAAWPPAMIASLNPALAAAAMNQGGAQVVPPTQVAPVQGYSMGGSAGYQNVAYQGPPPQQSGGSYQGPPMAPAMRPTAGPMGGYGPH